MLSPVRLSVHLAHGWTGGSVNKTAELSQRRPRDAPNIWVPRKISRVLTSPRLLFSEICNGRLFRWILRTSVQNWKFVALPVPEIIGGTSIFTRFRDIAAFVLQHATFSHPHLVSPKFPHVPLGVGGWPLGYEERRCWAKCSCN